MSNKIREIKDKHQGLTVNMIADLLSLPSKRTVENWLSDPEKTNYHEPPKMAAELLEIKLWAMTINPRQCGKTHMMEQIKKLTGTVEMKMKKKIHNL